MSNSVIKTKTIFLFGAYPEYLQKKVIKEMRKKKYTVKHPKTLNGLELDGDDIIVVDVRDMDDWKEQIGQRKDANYVPIETYVSCSTNHVYELVSYRAENKSEPFVLEDICKQSIDPSRFKMVSYESLKNGLVKYAKQVNDVKMMHLLEDMHEPMVEIIEVNTELEEAVKKIQSRKKKMDTVDEFQQTFDFC